MTWEETHRRQRILREIEAAADHDPTGELPWQAEWAELFIDAEGLLRELRRRWQLRLEAQVDPVVPNAADEMERTSSRLVAQNQGLLRILRRYPRSDGDPNPWEGPYVRAS